MDKPAGFAGMRKSVIWALSTETSQGVAGFEEVGQEVRMRGKRGYWYRKVSAGQQGMVPFEQSEHASMI